MSGVTQRRTHTLGEVAQAHTWRLKDKFCFMWAGVIFSFRAHRRCQHCHLGSFLKHHLQWKIIIFNIPTLFSTSQINHSGWITDNYQECNMTNAWLTLWLMYSLRIPLALSDWINISCHILTYSMWHGKHAVVRNWTNCFLWINLFVSRRGGKNPCHRKNNCQEGLFKQANANFWFGPYIRVCGGNCWWVKCFQNERTVDVSPVRW